MYWQNLTILSPVAMKKENVFNKLDNLAGKIRNQSFEDTTWYLLGTTNKIQEDIRIKGDH
jgi:hypothetical protein